LLQSQRPPKPDDPGKRNYNIAYVTGQT